MSNPDPKPAATTQTVTKDGKVHGVVSEFTDVDSLLAACRRVRDAGYTKADAFTPFPVHGIDSALGIKPTVLPWIALAAGLTGTSIALVMQIWMNGIDYQYIISGKPYISLPAFIPVTFELTILLASFGTFFGMWALNGLPRFSNPMFTSERFDRATDDTFFLYIPAKDARFDEEGAKALMGDLGGEHITPVVDDHTPTKIPKGLLIALAAGVGLTMIPLLSLARMRVTKSGSPRYHVFFDMDFSPSKGAQQVTTLFADGRSARPQVPGVVHRGGLGVESRDWDMNYQTGVDIEALSAIDAPRAARLVAMIQAVEEVSEVPDAAEEAEENKKVQVEEDADTDTDTDAEVKPNEPASTETGGAEPKSVQADAKSIDEAAKPPAEPEVDASPAEPDKTPWLKKNPLVLDEATLLRGQQQFGIYCSVCHGLNGKGQGLVHQRAFSILSQTWLQPSNMHDATLYSDKYPEGKLFSTITNGIRKMPGYGAQITVRDRWAIVGYVRALQASQNASLDDVPTGQRNRFEQRQAEVEAKLKAAAEAEAAKANAT